MAAMQDTATMAARAPTSSAHDLNFDDDELAATQQSILEELHTISEEVLPDLHHKENDETPEDHQPEHSTSQNDETVTEPEHLGPAVAHLRSQQAEKDSIDETTSAELPKFTFPEDGEIPAPPIQVKTEEALPVAVTAEAESETTAVSASDVLAEKLAEVATETTAEQAVEATMDTITEAVAETADQVQADGAEADELTKTQALVEAAEMTASLAVALDEQADDFLDHANLFDGIDADAFDDIELSPPVRRHAVLPPIESAISSAQNHAPASPTRKGQVKAYPPMLGLEDTFDKDDDIQDEPPPQASQMASFLDSSFAGFKTGRNKTIKPSEKSLQKAKKLLLDLEQTQDLLPPPLASQASSSQLPPPAFDSPMRDPQHPSVHGGGMARTLLDRAPMQEIAPRQSTVLNGSQGPPSPLKNKVVPIEVVTTHQVMPASQVERQPFATPKPIRNGFVSSSQIAASPLRTPLATSLARFTTPQPSKRVSLGTMARVEIGGSTGRKRAMPRFVTPFKGGKRPKGDDQEDPASPLRGQVNGGQTLSTPASMANRHYPPTSRTPSRTQASTSSSSAGPSVFNLSASVPRQKLSIFGRPETVSSLQMIARGVPDEVLVILATPSRAAQYAFESATGTLLQPPNALTELLARGCTSATLPWVQHHWSLILWKLAALVRLDPSSATQRWSWQELVHQLLYRYEREVHRAQRSCLKRIQEHDSAPGRPMVLFVSKIMEEENEVQERGGEVVMRKSTILELSDGWYRIQAQIDATLASACQRGRLQVGQKLAIMGATLDAQGDGNEVLAAYHMSTLVLASNSVSLAPWDARLGFSRTPFCASLRSLTPDGGLVSLMDIVITKVYPLAYVDVNDRSSSSGNAAAPRGEQEEAEERELWTRRREDAIAKLEMQVETQSRGLYDLVEALSDLAGDASFLPTLPDDPTGQLEAKAATVFDGLMAQQSPASAVNELVVKGGHGNVVPFLHNMAKAALLAEDTAGGLGGSSSTRLAADLDRICPPRRVREFRVVRFRDARLPPPPPPSTIASAASAAMQGGAKKKNPYARTVQLTVWDAATSLGDELQEGKRFLVTNLVPSSKSAWRKPDDEAEVFLSTRRDTKWRPVAL